MKRRWFIASGVLFGLGRLGLASEHFERIGRGGRKLKMAVHEVAFTGNGSYEHGHLQRF